MKTQSMRDAFWDRIYELAQTDRDIVIVSADLGAPSLDKFKEDMPDQFINVGIAEQNAILVASGLALAGKKPLAYAITQFITLRCYEQIRIYPCGMDLPISIVGVGAGSCYWESGPTHQCIEDVSAIRLLPKVDIYNSSDQVMARDLADIAVNGKSPKFIRLDRELICDLHENTINYDDGFDVLTQLGRINILATGNMVKLAKDVSQRIKEENGITVGVIDVFKIPLAQERLIALLKTTSRIITLEEHVLSGGMGSYILEMLSDAEIDVKIKRLGYDTRNGYSKFYNYGGREAIRGEFGIDLESVTTRVKMYI